ncbi:hypothetical protein BOC56_12380 [Burkholderia pseudomallei]|nr:hypothetical protein BOC56_12380 [Burkholderia pseudomallei]
MLPFAMLFARAASIAYRPEAIRLDARSRWQARFAGSARPHCTSRIALSHAGRRGLAADASRRRARSALARRTAHAYPTRAP